MIRRNYPARALVKLMSLSLALALAPIPSHSYIIETTVPPTGCPVPNHWPIAGPSSIRLRWSASIAPNTVITVAPYATTQQLTEIGAVVQQSLGAWTGVSGALINPSASPGAVAPIAQVAETNACTNDAESNVDGLNTICFNQSSSAFTNDGVLAFTRVITANAPGATVGSAPPALFAGQILDSDTLFNNTADVTFATPDALNTAQGLGAYDLESLLTHELGHFFGLDHSAVRRAILYPFAPTPGTFIGQRPTSSAPDAMLSDDDRTGLRVLYPDPADTVHVGTIAGRILPANPFATGGNSRGICRTACYGDIRHSSGRGGRRHRQCHSCDYGRVVMHERPGSIRWLLCNLAVAGTGELQGIRRASRWAGH